MTATTYERVLVPLDGSPLAEAVLPFAEKLAGPVDSELLLLRVVEPLAPAAALAAAGVPAPDELFLRQVEARRYLDEVARRLGDKGLRVRTLLGHGPAASEIVAVAKAERADLIAMSTHGRGGLGRLLFGSVAEAVLRAAPVPVLMVRMTPGAATAGGEATR